MRREERNDKIRNDFFKEAKKLSISLDRKNGINRYTFITFDFLKEMHVWAAWNGVALPKNVMNHLPLIRKILCKKNSLHKAELFLSSKPSQTSPTELNIQLIKQKAKRKAIHQSELNLVSKGTSSSSKLNYHFAKKREQEKRLHAAQIASMLK